MRPSAPGARYSLSRRGRTAAGRGGFHLIELLVTISILGIMLAYAAWSITGSLPRWRLEGAANEIVMRFQQARAEAVRRNGVMVVALNNVGSTSSSSISVTEDTDGDYIGDTVLTTTIIPQSYTRAYISAAADGGGAVTMVAIGSDGTIRSVNAGGKGTMPVVITMDSQDTTDPDTYLVEIQRTGVARVKKP